MNTDTKYNLIRDIFINKALEAADEDDGREFEPSDKFKVTLNKNLRANGMEPFYSFFSVKRRRVLAVIAAVVAAFALSMSVGAIRERVVSFFIEMFDTFAVITTDKNNDYPDKIEDCYSPAYIPEGFEIIETDLELFEYSITLKNKDNDTIFFFQNVQGVNKFIDTEQRVEKIKVFSDDDGVLWESQNIRSLYYEHSGYYFTIITRPELDENVLVNIAKSIEKTEFTKS